LFLHEILEKLTMSLMSRSTRHKIVLEVVVSGEWEYAFDENSRHQVFKRILLLIVTVVEYP
jgi:hypothetical protein